MSTDRWAIQAGEPRNPESESHLPTVALEEYLEDGRLEPQPDDVDNEELAEAIAVAGPEGTNERPTPPHSGADSARIARLTTRGPSNNEHEIAD